MKLFDQKGRYVHLHQKNKDTRERKRKRKKLRIKSYRLWLLHNFE